MLKLKAVGLAFVAVVSIIVTVACASWKQDVRDVTPLAVQQCQVVCHNEGRDDLAKWCTVAGGIAAVLEQLLLEQRQMRAAAARQGVTLETSDAGRD